MRGLRKRYRILLLAALVAAFVVRMGFALSLETTSVATTMTARHAPAASVRSTASAAVASSVLVSSATPTATALVHPGVPDGAKLLLVGTILFGLAAAVRKAV
jgi:hypothetical protein